MQANDYKLFSIEAILWPKYSMALSLINLYNFQNIRCGLFSYSEIYCRCILQCFHIYYNLIAVQYTVYVYSYLFECMYLIDSHSII